MTKKKKSSTLGNIEAQLKKEYKFLQRFKDKNENHLLFAAFLVVMTSMVVVNTIFVIDYVPGMHNRNSSSQVGDLNKVMTSLQKVKTDAFEVKISNVTVTDKPDSAFTTAPTDIMMIMDISIVNTSSGIQQLVPSNQLFVRDRQGGLYMLHPSSYVTKPLVLTDLEPGQTVDGQLSFAIPKILAHPLLYVDLGWNDNAPAVIDVMK